VIVIGAGFAGLSAACALADRGARVTVLEARPTLGGRATAFTDPHTGERVDNGQHILMGCYHETFRFLERIGAESHVRLQPSLMVDVIERDGRSSRLVCPPLPSPLHLVGGVLEWEALSWRDRLSILRLREPLANARAQLKGRTGRRAASPDETVKQWLERNGQTPKLVELLWEPLAVAALNQPINQATAEPFARVLAQMLGPDPRDAAVGVPLRPLDELYIEPARIYLEARGATIRTNAPARVVIEGETVTHVAVREEKLRAAAVICAAPWYAWPDILNPVTSSVTPLTSSRIANPSTLTANPSPLTAGPSPLTAVLDAAAKTPASPIVTVNLWFDRVVLDVPFVGLPGRVNQWVFDKRVAFGERASHLSTVSSGAASVVLRTNQELIDLAMEEITDAIPAARAANLRNATVVREKRSTFSLAPGLPPRPKTRTSINGLLLAGDWIDTGLPATIESAVISGRMAAEEFTN
jgi:squalene-associated FAD-dependent desaturase